MRMEAREVLLCVGALEKADNEDAELPFTVIVTDSKTAQVLELNSPESNSIEPGTK
jgi:hypothetical protein